MASTTPPAATEQPRHYPLNGLDLSFSRYHHRELDVADITANRLMNHWLFPRGSPRAWQRRARARKPPKCPRVIPLFKLETPHPRLQDRDLQSDRHVFILSQTTRGGGHPCLASPPPDAGDPAAVLLAALRRHVFETSHPEVRPWLRWLPRGYPARESPFHDNSVGCCPTHSLALDRGTDLPPAALGRFFFFLAQSTARTWLGADLWRAHTLYLASASLPLHALPDPLVTSGPILQDARRNLGPLLWRPGPLGVAPPVPNVTSYLPTRRCPSKFPERYVPAESGEQPGLFRSLICPAAAYSTTLRTRRSASEPPAGSYMFTVVQDAYVRQCQDDSDGGEPHLASIACWPEYYLRNRLSRDFPFIPLFAPCPRVAEVDHRTRRRSLSRRHVARMFHSPSRTSGSVLTPNPEVGLHHPASCCGRSAHRAPRRLPARCGWCGSASHPAHACPVPSSARCKCGPFPTYHAAEACLVLCSRPCGDERRRGGSQHRNAMTCRSRCCMCGIRGHSGRECRLGRCRCGGRHLGQDCGWKPGCKAGGCDRYLCGVHCRECGSTERPFVGWRCGACLGNGKPVGEPVVEKAGDRPGKRRRGKRKGKAGAGAGAEAGAEREDRQKQGSSEKIGKRDEQGRGRKK